MPSVSFSAPTRELAQQIEKVMRALGLFASEVPRSRRWHTSVRGIKESSIWRPRRRYSGRVYDMLRRRALKPDSIKIFSLDEADEMLSRGFKDQIYDIFPIICRRSCKLAFSVRLCRLKRWKLLVSL